jgi:hypothetical protein
MINAERFNKGLQEVDAEKRLGGAFACTTAQTYV